MKTLLVGLGGTGCIVVSRVMQMVGEHDPSIQFLGFDTDTNQEEAPNLPLVQTSRDAKVAEILMGEKDWQEWFPNNKILMSRDMLKGAGQIRALSRLAFSDTIRHKGAIAELDRALKALNMKQKDPKNEKMKIMVVSSFAGGTGSGMFIQAGLFFRKYIRENYLSDVMIRGLFALPDVYLMSQKFNKVQAESMYANAYASLKELAAINTICMSSNPAADHYNLRINGLFDSKAIRANFRNADVDPTKTTADKKPFGFIFFMDNLNRNHNVLANHDDYLDQMAEITYMQVYSPLEGKTDSREDNFIADVMQSDGEALYGSAGASRMVYPYDDIVEYCTLRSMSAAIGTKWTALDKQFQQQLEAARERQKTDRNIKLPVLGTFFTTTIDGKLKNRDSGYAFIRDGISRQIIRKLTDSKGHETGGVEAVPEDRATVFWEKVTRYIQKCREEDTWLSQKHDSCDNQNTKLKTFDDIKKYRDSIKHLEGLLRNYYEAIEDRVESMNLTIANAVIPQELGGIDDDTSKEYNIRNLLEMINEEGKRHAVHPLAARYLLYKIRDEVKKLHDEASKKAGGARDEINTYFEKDYDQRTKDKTDTIMDIAPKFVLGRPSFSRRYLNGFKNQLKRLDSYCVNSLNALVTEKLLTRLEKLINHYAMAFSSLDVVMTEMNNRAKIIESLYKQDTPTRTYLCAAPTYMRNLYDELNIEGEDSATSEIYDSMFSEIYTSAMNTLEMERENKNYSKEMKKALEETLRATMNDLFRTSVLDYYRESVRQKGSSLLDMNAFKALEKELSYRLQEKAIIEKHPLKWSNDEISAARREMLDVAYAKAAPYLICNETHPRNESISSDSGNANWIDMSFWGLSDDAWKDIQYTSKNPESMLATKESDSPDLTVSRMYSKYEISCYRALYCVRLSEIPKFSEDPGKKGIFYQHYENRVRKMLEGMYGSTDEGLTPHLDIHWHSSEYLPMINTAKESEDKRNAARAMWLGLMFGGLKEKYNTQNGKLEVFARFVTNPSGKRMPSTIYDPRQLRYFGKAVILSQPYEIYKALEQDSLTVSQLLEVYAPRLEAASVITDENYNFSGKSNVNPLALKLIDTRGDGLKIESVVEDTTAQTTKKAGNSLSSNPLSILVRIVRNRQATEEEKQIIANELFAFLDEFTSQMSDSRKYELLKLIFSNSVLTKQQQRTGAEVAYSPYFDTIVNEYIASQSN